MICILSVDDLSDVRKLRVYTTNIPVYGTTRVPYRQLSAEGVIILPFILVRSKIFTCHSPISFLFQP